MTQTTKLLALSSTLLLLTTQVVYAHTGVGLTTGFNVGFLHPIGGFDHLLAMVAVGLWSTQRDRNAILMLPVTFIGIMILGGILGMAGFHLPYVETGILVSILILGIFTALALKLSLTVSMLVVGCFALFHGHAHGTEMPLIIDGLFYSIGFASATALLHLSGIALGITFQKFSIEKVTRFVGVTITMSSFYWLFT